MGTWAKGREFIATTYLMPTIKYLCYVIFFLAIHHTVIADTLEEQTIELKFKTAEKIIPKLTPYLINEGSLQGFEYRLTIKSTKENIKQIKQQIVTLDVADIPQIIISITMNMQAIHNVNTRNIQVPVSSWVTINYGLQYPIRKRIKQSDGTLIENLVYKRVTNSFQLYTETDGINVTIKIRPTIEIENDAQETNITEDDDIEPELLTENLESTLTGKLKQWMKLGKPLSEIYLYTNEPEIIIRHRSRLINNMGIKIHLIQQENI